MVNPYTPAKPNTKSEPFANELKAWQYAKQPDRGHRKADPRAEGDVRSLLVEASAVLLVWPKDVTERILLIIDDLDRCLPAESIEILEALKLLLEDPAMAERIIGKCWALRFKRNSSR
jgi:hypothetical protein